jgi:hypothetical protein
MLPPPGDSCAASASDMKKSKKKIALPRRSWQINPVTRVKESARKYSRSRNKQRVRKASDEE